MQAYNELNVKKLFRKVSGNIFRKLFQLKNDFIPVCIYSIPTEKTAEYKSYKRLPQCVAKFFPELFSRCTTELDDRREFITVGFLGGDPVSCVYGEIDEVRVGKDGMLESNVHITRLEVRESMRRMGYGRQLVNLLVERYRPYEMYLFPLDEAVPFWKSVGFSKGMSGGYMRKRFKH